MKLSELVEIKQEECPKCISYTYTLAHQIDKELCYQLRVFGREQYPIDVVQIFKIEEPDKFFIECILGTKYLKIWFSKSLGTEINKRVSILRDCLVDWFSDRFNSDIERD